MLAITDRDKGVAPTQVASARCPLTPAAHSLPPLYPASLWRLIMLPLFSNLIGSSKISYLDNKRPPINQRSGTSNFDKIVYDFK